MKLGSVFDDDFQDIVMFLTKPMKWTPAGPSLRSMTTFPGCPRPCIEIPESDCAGLFAVVAFSAV